MTAEITVGQFAQKIEDWHQERVNQLRDMLDLNPSKIALQDRQGNEVTLTDRNEIDAYLKGVALGLDTFLKLPFTIEVNDIMESINEY